MLSGCTRGLLAPQGRCLALWDAPSSLWGERFMRKGQGGVLKAAKVSMTGLQPSLGPEVLGSSQGQPGINKPSTLHSELAVLTLTALLKPPQRKRKETLLPAFSPRHHCVTMCTTHGTGTMGTGTHGTGTMGTGTHGTGTMGTGFFEKITIGPGIV